MLRTLQDEAFEGILSYLQSQEEGEVCIKCWSLFLDGTCPDEDPIWWPLDHALRKLEGYVSY
jgi:hypothetical protein